MPGSSNRPLLTNRLSIVVRTIDAGELGCLSFTRDDWNKIQDNPSGNCLKRDFKLKVVDLKLTLTLKIHTSTETADQVSEWLSAKLGNPPVWHTSDKDGCDLWKADELNLLGDHFLEAFETTHDNEDICKAIEAYRQAAACLPIDDSRLGPFLLDICFGYQGRYDIFGSTQDLEEAITIGQMAITVTAEDHQNRPVLLSNLGSMYYRRFELTGDLDDISKAIQNHQRAVELTPEGDRNLLRRLSNLGSSFCDRFECTGDPNDISKAIQYGQRAVDLSPDGDDELPGRLCNLGMAFETRFDGTGDLDDISNAIQHQQRAVQLAPDGHNTLPVMLDNLGSSFTSRFSHTGDLADISQAIQNRQRAIQLTQEGSAELPNLLANLGKSFRLLFDYTGKLDDISQAIQYVQRAVHLTPDGHVLVLADKLTILGNAFLSRFDHTGDLDDVFGAFQNHQRAVQLTPKGHADMPDKLCNLGNTFVRRFQRTGDSEDISLGIQNLKLAVGLSSDRHAHLPAMLTNLAGAYLCHFQRTGDPRSISEAIENQRRAVQLTPDEHIELGRMLNSLGTILLERFKHDGDVAELSEAIQNKQRAVQLTPDEHADLPSLLSSLGSSFLHRYERTGNLDDIAQAIQKEQLAIQLTPVGHTRLPTSLNNLGIMYASRFERTGDLGDISNAIQNQQRAVQLTPDGHAELSNWLGSLGSSFFDRFKYTEKLDDITEAIQNLQRAVQLLPCGHPDLAMRLNNLGNAFCYRFKDAENIEDISEAIKLQKHAIQLTPEGHTDLPVWFSNLGSSLCDRFRSTKNPNDISEAIHNQQRAVQLTTVEAHPDLPGMFSNLGISFYWRFKYANDLDDIFEAIRNQQRAIELTPEGHADLSGRFLNLGNKFFGHFEATGDHESRSNAVLNYRLAATSLSGPLSVRLRSAVRWAAISQQSPALQSNLLDAHGCIIRLLSLVSGLENTVQHRYEALSECSHLSTAAFAVALGLDHPDKALEWLEEGRCIVWNQINQLRAPVDELRAHDPALAERLSTLSRELENAGSRSESDAPTTSLSLGDKISLEEQAGRHGKFAKEWDQLLNSIRDISGFEHFLRPRKCADIMRQLPEEGIIIIINVSNPRCDGLVLRAGDREPIHVPLPDFSYEEAERLSKGLQSLLLQHHRVASRKFKLVAEFDANDRPPDLPEILEVLWSNVVRPILEAVSIYVCDSARSKLPGKLPRIWWCPTGPLAFLPVHAAGIYNQAEGKLKECLPDFAVSSYIPTVNYVLRTSKLTSIEKGDVRTGFLVLSQTNTPGQTRIPFAADEAKKVSKQLEKQRISTVTLDDQKGTVDDLLNAMESFHYIHLACHASQDLEKPLKSSIHLHDGPLRLSEVMKKNLLHADFAFLSACQTSMGDRDLPEEAIHLAAGMLAAGYRSVVGTMWSIFDRHGPDLAEFFYESFLDNTTSEGSKVDGTGAARALHHATQRLRMKHSDSPECLLAWVPYIHLGI